MLARDRTPVRLGGKAFSILHLLLVNAGREVSKQAIIDSVWPDTHVDEASLKVHVSSLRRTLGDNLRTPEYIATIAGHGYQFIEKVFLDRADPEDVKNSEDDLEDACYSLPNYPPLVGRESDIERIARALDNSSLLTLVGAGGVGKTSLAVTAAHRLCSRFPDGAHFVDLSAAEGPSLVAQVITRSLGLRGDLPDLIAFLSGHLRGRSMLLILDNCEHVLPYAADLCAQYKAIRSEER